MPKGSGGLGKFIVTVMLIYCKHWAIVAYSVKLSDIIALGTCEVHFLKKAITVNPLYNDHICSKLPLTLK